MEKNFEIGQVVYILSEQSQSILPGIIAEEVVVKTISGNSVSWKIKVGNGDKAKLFDSLKIKGEVYGSLEEVRGIMTKRLNDFIDKISQEANDRVEKWYGKEVAERARQQQDPGEQDKANSSGDDSSGDDRIDPDALLNAIENKISLHQSSRFGTDPQAGARPRATSRAELKQRLTALAVPEEENGQGGEGDMFVSLPSGELVPVRMQKPKIT